MFDEPVQRMDTAKESLGRVRQVSYREQILNHLNHHMEQITKYQEILKLIDENPVIEKFMNLNRM